MKTERLGLFGGTFAPPHRGHVHALDAFLRTVKPDRTLVMPTGIPPHKSKDGGDTPAARLAMCRAAFGTFPGVEISDYEIKKDGPSYTVETLRHLEAPDREILLLCGSDMFLTLSRWFQSEEIFHRAVIVGLAREADREDEMHAAKADYEKRFGARVILIDEEPVEISSTDVRRAIRDGEDLAPYLPEAVIDVIRAEHLYEPEEATMEKRILDEAALAELSEKVRPYLTPKRYAHTKSVEKEAAALGAIYLPDKIPSLRAAALLHDITKKEDAEKQLQICAEFGIIVEQTDRLSPAVFHAKTGAAVAARDFAPFTDDEILSGIRWHTTGHSGMTRFECLVYLADYIEETRTFDDCTALRREFYDRIGAGEDPEIVLTDVMIRSFDYTIAQLIEAGQPVAAESVAARNEFLIKRHDGQPVSLPAKGLS
ncbi:MAG: nicotinate (nicotinamide) nucleotide adenylyltransferase [Clostridia bacterium]|nr:nicotinate (nicotinamide) nucleotide adenylyltransferase [Clostridia bacterium]